MGLEVNWPGRPDGERYLLWDVWEEAHGDLARRVEALEAAAAERGRRLWALTLAALTGLALPLLAAVILAALH